MNTHADSAQKNKSNAVASNLPEQQIKSESAIQFADNRPEAIVQRKLQEMANNSARVKQLGAIQAMANKHFPQKTHGKETQGAEIWHDEFESVQKKSKSSEEAVENVLQKPERAKPAIQMKSGAYIIQRAIMPVAGIEHLRESDVISNLISDYNKNYNQETLDNLVALARNYEAKGTEEKKSLRNLITELDKEVGNRHVVVDRVKLPRDINDAKGETMEKNCALTSVGALLGCKASDINHALRGDRYFNQGSEVFEKNKIQERKGDDPISRQINGMVSYVDAAFKKMGFSVEVSGQTDNYEMMPAEQGLAAMKEYPTGTKFLVYMRKRIMIEQVFDKHAEEKEVKADQILRSHWVFADRYGSQIFFYDYQVGRVQAEIKKQAQLSLRSSSEKDEEKFARGNALEAYKKNINKKSSTAESKIVRTPNTPEIKPSDPGKGTFTESPEDTLLLDNTSEGPPNTPEAKPAHTGKSTFADLSDDTLLLDDTLQGPPNTPEAKPAHTGKSTFADLSDDTLLLDDTLQGPPNTPEAKPAHAGKSTFADLSDDTLLLDDTLQGPPNTPEAKPAHTGKGAFADLSDDTLLLDNTLQGPPNTPEAKPADLGKVTVPDLPADDSKGSAAERKIAAPEDILEMPKATFVGQTVTYKKDPSDVVFADYNEMFFVAVIPHIVNREILQDKLRETKD